MSHQTDLGQRAIDNISQLLGYLHGCSSMATMKGPCLFCVDQAKHAARAVRARPIPA